MRQTRNLNAAHCLDLVRENDLDRYLSSLLATQDQHRALFAIYAFDAEICNIAGQVSEPAIGEIRLQWWRDTIDAMFDGNCNDQPVAKELQLAVHKHDLPKHLFINLIDARQFDLYGEPMASVDDLISYQTATTIAITDLAARILIGNDALKISLAIEKAGIARGLAKLLSTLPVQITRKQCFLPADLLKKHELDFKHVLARENSPGMQSVIAQLGQMIVDQLKQLRHERSGLKKAVLPAFFPASLADLALENITATDCNLLKQPATTSQLKMQWFLLKKSLFKKI